MELLEWLGILGGLVRDNLEIHDAFLTFDSSSPFIYALPYTTFSSTPFEHILAQS
jgi:hypothetical protein